MSGEFTFIDWIRGQTRPNTRVLIGPGDDCAALSPGRSPWLITTDMLMDGTDFVLAEVGPHRVGLKAMAVNLSDLAAMAGRPVGVVVSVALPRGDDTLGRDLYHGLREMADSFGVPIVGGDTNSWAGPLVISVTAFGEAERPVRRNGAKPGDWLFVTGPLGGSILGHHLDFTPRIAEALRLHETVDLHAMIDISDGLSADLHHILEESRCGAVLHAEAIPIAEAARQLTQQSSKTPLEHALGDGEDFELVFAVSPEDGEKLLREPPVQVWKIGECVADGYWIEEQKNRRPLVPTGWVHSL
ncbi:thiamine-monophosphate kinase [Limnoglobus roseus]|uniref:Thiamine-monophosphate kinase n=2 Tax=Limnoglobus roseus TaxID=2598579 RepID=A0A5C1A4B9_9BACT|nr:thiamine-monophosphate kinase [Limnoglobus roseus]